MVNYKEFNDRLVNIINEGVAKDMIIVDGVVGVGKSSLMEILAEELNLTVFPEPVMDNPLLPKFYEDMKKYGFPLQVFFLNNRFRMIKEAQRLNGAIMDRAIYGDVIFAKMLGEQCHISKEELDCYLDLFANMMEHLPTPEGRDFEQDTPRQYWEDLNREYDDYFSSCTVAPVLTIDVSDLDYVNNTEDRKYVVGLIKDKLKEIRGR